MNREEFWDLWTLSNNIESLNMVADLAVLNNISKSKSAFFLAYTFNLMRDMASCTDLSDISPEWFRDRLLAYSKLFEDNKALLERM